MVVGQIRRGVLGGCGSCFIGRIANRRATIRKTAVPIPTIARVVVIIASNPFFRVDGPSHDEGFSWPRGGCPGRRRCFEPRRGRAKGEREGERKAAGGPEPRGADEGRAGGGEGAQCRRRASAHRPDGR